MRVLFIDRSHPWDRIGVYVLSNAIKSAGHKVDYAFSDLEDVDCSGVDFVLFSIMTTEYPWFKDVNDRIRSQFDVKTVVGGPHATFCPGSLEHDDNIDYVVRGPGEEAIVSILNGEENDKVIKAPMTPASCMAKPDRSIYDKYAILRESKLKRFMSTRGCPHNCTYCHNSKYRKLYSDQKKMFMDRLSPEQLVDDIVDVITRYGLEMVFLQDDDIAYDRRWLEEFCGEYKSRVNCGFVAQTRVDHLTEDLAHKMANAGCRMLIMAIESADPWVRDNILKRGRYTNGQIEQSVKLCKWYGIKTRTLSMIGLPVEDPLGDALRTLEFNQQLSPTSASATILQPFPGTPIYERCSDLGLLGSDQCLTFREGTILKLRDSDKINNLIRWWDLLVRSKVPMEWVKLMLDMDIDADVSRRMHELTMHNIFNDFFDDNQVGGNCDYLVNDTDNS